MSTPIRLIARTSAGRPTLQHVLRGLGGSAGEVTACGLEVEGWTRAYQRERIEQVECRRCAATLPETWAIFEPRTIWEAS